MTEGVIGNEYGFQDGTVISSKTEVFRNPCPPEIVARSPSCSPLGASHELVLTAYKVALICWLVRTVVTS